jgi:hypothetical protein
MKTVKVTYTTKAEYAQQNHSNIQQVMKAMQEINNPNIRYECFLGPDGKSFMHLAVFQTDEAEQVLLTLPEFKSFQEQLKASGPEAPPRSEVVSLVGTSVA